MHLMSVDYLTVCSKMAVKITGHTIMSYNYLINSPLLPKWTIRGFIMLKTDVTQYQTIWQKLIELYKISVHCTLKIITIN